MKFQFLFYVNRKRKVKSFSTRLYKLCMNKKRRSSANRFLRSVFAFSSRKYTPSTLKKAFFFGFSSVRIPLSLAIIKYYHKQLNEKRLDVLRLAFLPFLLVFSLSLPHRLAFLLSVPACPAEHGVTINSFPPLTIPLL